MEKKDICQTEFIYMFQAPYGDDYGSDMLPVLMEVGSEFSTLGVRYKVSEIKLTNDRDLIQEHLGDDDDKLYILVVCDFMEQHVWRRPDVTDENNTDLIGGDKIKSLIRDYKLNILL